jgi:hypothetical protein
MLYNDCELCSGNLNLRRKICSHASTPTPPPPPPRCPPRSGALRSPPPPPRALRTRLHPVYLLLGSFFPGGPVPAGSAPTSAGQRRASAPSGDLQADGRVSFADVVRLGHLNSARGRPPPSYQSKRTFTAPRSNCVERPRPAATAARNGPSVTSEELGWTYITRRKDRSGRTAPNGFRRSTRRQFMATQRPTAFKPATHRGAPGLQPSYSRALLQLLGQGAPGGGLQRPHLLL